MEKEIEPDMRMYMIIQHLFISSLRMEQLMNRELGRDGLTVKQFHLLWVTGTKETPPSIKDLANDLATSHQNVKQISLLLQKKGFLRLEKDPSDRRTWRVHLTEANEFYWKKRAPDHDRSIREIFGTIHDNDLTLLEKELFLLREELEKQI